MSEEIKAMEEEVRRLRLDLEDARRRLNDARIVEVGVSVGDIVRGKRDGNTYRVARIDPRHSCAWITANPMRKDGTYGTAERNLYENWERVTP
jgi:hypothetical protein